MFSLISWIWSFVSTKLFQHGTLTLFVETLIPTLWNCQRTQKHEFKMNLPKVSLVSYELYKMIPYDSFIELKSKGWVAEVRAYDSFSGVRSHFCTLFDDKKDRKRYVQSILERPILFKNIISCFRTSFPTLERPFFVLEHHILF